MIPEFLLLETLAVLTAYLIGSIPSAVWMGKLLYGVDVREFGSKNAGATNTIRTLGIGAGIPVLLMDVFKGWIVIRAAALLHYGFSQDYLFINFELMMGTAALIGHVFPVFAGFRGGKGIATLVGIAIAIFPWAILFSIGIFILVFILWHYVSLGSIVAAIIFPIAVIFIFRAQTHSLILFSILVALFVPYTHRKNIRRIFHGEESKFSFKRRKRNNL